MRLWMVATLRLGTETRGKPECHLIPELQLRLLEMSDAISTLLFRLDEQGVQVLANLFALPEEIHISHRDKAFKR
ncbi:hypothetical protein PybrP1_000636 [[Pythium] brassicae (nom. inval.)]|nr:hypothetical protein PybrP1_000636 [[Pythium] brassicae (nom. inval.)]